MKKIIIIKAGDTFPDMAAKYGGFDQWVINGLGVDADIVQVVDVTKGERLPEPAEILGAVMTGSHSMVTERLDWSVRTAEWIKKTADAGVPFLGICYGHQLLADALGGEAGYHPGGMEIGSADIILNDNAKTDPLFKNLPETFKAHTVHSQTALRLPAGAVILASNNHDSHHSFRVGKCAWGVQFHPEFSASIMKDYISKYAEKLENPEKVLSEVTETEEASSVLRGFAQICLS